MSYWISLLDRTAAPRCNYEEGSPDPSRCPEPCHPVFSVMPHGEGGTPATNGTDEAELNVTYNYASKFDFRGLHGRTGKETLPELVEARDRLGMAKHDDHWKDTDGNVGFACSVLARWARAYPHGTWEVM